MLTTSAVMWCVIGPGKKLRWPRPGKQWHRSTELQARLPNDSLCLQNKDTTVVVTRKLHGAAEATGLGQCGLAFSNTLLGLACKKMTRKKGAGAKTITVTEYGAVPTVHPGHAWGGAIMQQQLSSPGSGAKNSCSRLLEESGQGLPTTPTCVVNNVTTSERHTVRCRGRGRGKNTQCVACRPCIFVRVSI